MSIENKLDELTQAVVALTDAVRALHVTAPVAEKPKAKKEAKIEKVVEVVDAVEPVEVITEKPTVAIDRNDLQTICAEIVRGDRAKKNAIRSLLATYDGAKTLTQVPDDKLAELKEKLEALK